MIIKGDGCITKDCGNIRVAPNWYCQSCLDSFRRDQDQRRGTIGKREGGTGMGNGDGKKRGAPFKTGGAGTGTTMINWDKGGRAGDRWDPKRGTWTSDPGPQSDPTGEREGVDWRPTLTNAVGSGTTRPQCDHGGHNGKVPSLVISGKTIYGAQGHKLNAPENVAHLNLIVDCAGLVNGTKFVSGGTNARLSRSLNMAAFPDVVRLQWPDMTAPVHVGIRFWERLLETIPDHTCICCVGSHGRTGTAMAALLVASGMDPDDAIREVRAKHCKRAIETAGQESYIRNLGKERDRRNRDRDQDKRVEGGVK